MAKLRTLLAGAAIAALAGVGYVLGQATVSQTTLSGNECWNAGQGPGGPSTGFICTYLMRNGSAMQIISGSGTINTVMTPTQSTLFWHATAPTAWNITLPTPSFDGELVTIGTDTTLTTLVTITAPSGTTLNANQTYNSQTLGGTSSVEWQFSAPSATWNRLR